METLRSYLESMFMNLPNTTEVYKAKDELWQMMEDKYQELLEEGKSDNEAIGIVISEFGNLDEIAKVLGIDQVVKETYDPRTKTITMDEIKKYIADQFRHAKFVALGVLLCILSVCAPILFSGIGQLNGGYMEERLEICGAVMMFVMVAAAVGVFIYSNIIIGGRWQYLFNGEYRTDFDQTEYLQSEMENYKPNYAIGLALGVILCILAVLPPILLSGMFYNNDFIDCLSGALFFVFVAVGVYLIVYNAMKMSVYKRLLNINKEGTVGSVYTRSQKSNLKYTSKAAEAIMTTYWPAVTCIFLIWSFLTFDWYITWIIWPVAAVIHALLKVILCE